MNQLKFESFIEEQAVEIANGISTKHFVDAFEILSENKKILDSLEKTQTLYLKDDQITKENFEFFKDSLKKIASTEIFKEQAILINLKLYAVKKFTEFEFELPKNLENILQFELKKYFTNLLTSNSQEFAEQLFKLPFEFTSMVIRYVNNELSPETKEQTIPAQEEADKFFEKILQKREKFIKTINKLSMGENNIFNIPEAKLLLDTKAFFKYNAVNCGVIEYVVRLFNNDKAQEKLYSQFGQDHITLMRDQALHHPSYIRYLKKIRESEIEPFFTADGLQNEKREKTFNDYVEELFTPANIVPKTPKPSNETLVDLPEVPEVQDAAEEKPEEKPSAEEPKEPEEKTSEV